MNLVDGYCDHCGPDAPKTLMQKRQDRRCICDEIKHGYDYYTCDLCGVGFYHQRYDENAWITRVYNNTQQQAAQVERFGNWTDRVDNREHLRQAYAAMWKRAGAYAGDWCARVFEVGCHVGHSIPPAIAMGLEVHACEPDLNAHQYAANKGTIHVQPTLFCDACATPKSFDVVIMNDTIEHTFTPWRDLQKASVISRQGGVLMVKTFAEDMEGSERYIGLGHEWHFPTSTLLQWIHDAGWNIMSVEPNEEWAQVTVWGKKR